MHNNFFNKLTIPQKITWYVASVSLVYFNFAWNGYEEIAFEATAKIIILAVFVLLSFHVYDHYWKSKS